MLWDEVPYIIEWSSIRYKMNYHALKHTSIPTMIIHKFGMKYYNDKIKYPSYTLLSPGPHYFQVILHVHQIIQ